MGEIIQYRGAFQGIGITLIGGFRRILSQVDHPILLTYAHDFGSFHLSPTMVDVFWPP